MDLPTEATPQGAPEDPEVAADARSPVYTDGQQVEYPPYESEGEQIQVHPVQYQPHQPGNPEVLVVDDPDINIDGESTSALLLYFEFLNLFLSNHYFYMFSVFSYNLGTCTNNRNKCSQFADCKDYSGGYCCHCRPGFYGNGIQCVAEGNIVLLLLLHLWV